MSTQAMALAKWLPDIETQTPNGGDVVQVLAVPVNESPTTQFTPMGGGGGGGAALPRATAAGQFMLAGNGPTFNPTWGDGDAGRY
jgi:hypothetical protein